MASKKSTPKFGLFYRSQGRMTGPYRGITRTLRGWTRQPISGDVTYLKNNILKSRIEFRQVSPAVLG
jgi:hypothetical protein